MNSSSGYYSFLGFLGPIFDSALSYILKYVGNYGKDGDRAWGYSYKKWKNDDIFGKE